MFGIVYFLLIGLAAGWLAGKVMKGQSFGLLGNLVVGVVGAVLGGFLVRASWPCSHRLAWKSDLGNGRGSCAAVPFAEGQGMTIMRRPFQLRTQ